MPGRDLCTVESEFKKTGVVTKLGFQVAAVSKPLTALQGVKEKGKHVCCGPRDEKKNHFEREDRDGDSA